MDFSSLKRVVLVVGSHEDRSFWKRLFDALPPLSDGSRLCCVVSDWESMQLTSFSHTDVAKRLQVQIKDEGVHFVELVVVRKLCRGLDVKDDHRNKLFAMMHAGIPSVNSLSSIYFCLDRAPCHSALREIQDRHGWDSFPLIDQSYYANFRTGKFTPDVPFVVKVGHAEAGYGKMVIRESFDDFLGVLALHGDYFTCEPFYDKEYDLRIQKVGKHLRAYERRSSNWKTNVGSSVLTEVDVKPHWRKWAELAATAFGGLDILTVDAMHLKDGREIIIEINDTASGFASENKEVDCGHVVELAVERMEQFLKAGKFSRLAAVGKKGIKI